MDTLIPVEQHERILAERIAPLREALAQAKQVIAKLQTQRLRDTRREQPGGADSGGSAVHRCELGPVAGDDAGTVG